MDEEQRGEEARTVAIIMDGNGRWAERRGLPVAEGHQAGTRALRRTVEAAIDLGLELQEQMTRLEEETAANDRLNLWVALDYGGRAEIVEAARRLAEAGIDPSEMDENALRANLYAPELPDPDLLIRTSGELRISNFLLWQLAYSELVFTDTLWPDFGHAELEQALAAYANRRRRFGGR